MIALDHINIHADDLEAARDFLLLVLPGLTDGYRRRSIFSATGSIWRASR